MGLAHTYVTISPMRQSLIISESELKCVDNDAVQWDPSNPTPLIPNPLIYGHPCVKDTSNCPNV